MAERLQQLDVRSIARAALALMLQGRVEEAAAIYERLIASVEVVIPSISRLVCGMVRRILEERYDVTIDECRLARLRRILEEAVEPRLKEMVPGYENMTPAERRAATERLVSQMLCDVGFIVARFLGLY